MPRIYTIGHSDLTADKFIAALQKNGVKAVADVRSLTGSNAFPQFNSDKLRAELRKAGITYRAIGRLGGRRNRNYKIDPHTNGAWTNTSFRNYADYATTQPFASGLVALERLARKKATAFMCSEAVWWRCHRRLISDHLLAKGWDVQHIMGGGKLEKATYNPGAVVKDGAVTYPGDAWAKAHPQAAKHGRVSASTNQTEDHHGNQEIEQGARR